jgi:flavin reductase (DIM6/NTAB) family NADH-FMN oxidoreductase RutF
LFSDIPIWPVLGISDIIGGMADDSQTELSRVLGQIPSGVSILTARAGKQSTGMLASWVQQASFEPPAVTVAVKMSRPIESIIEASGQFVVNLLSEDRSQMFKHFGKGFAPDESAFDGLAVRDVEQGVVIDACLSHLGCKVLGTIDAGDHRIYVGQVIEAEVHSDARPYVHLRANGLRY